jgi:hypothetical protein
MPCNTIYFDRLNCRTAEAIFGDTIEIFFGGRRVWLGVVNTNQNLTLPQNLRLRIPQGEGGILQINQWYFGQTMQTVFTAFIRQTDEEGEKLFQVDPWFDSDPNGEYTLSVRLTLE